MHTFRLSTGPVLCLLIACASNDVDSSNGGDDSGGASGVGGSNSAAGASGTAGSSATGGSANAGAPATGGSGMSGSAAGGVSGTASSAGMGGAGTGAAGMGAAGIGGAGSGAAGSGGAGIAGAGGGNGGSTGEGAAGMSGAGAGGKGGAGAGGAGMGGAAMGGKGGAGSGGAGGSNACPAALEGWATVNANGVNGTTGGGSAAPVTVRTFAELSAAVQGNTAGVVVISGTIRTTDGGGYALRIGSNKTLVGADRNATIYGGIEMNGVSNVIVRNLNVHGVWPNSGPDDTIASRGSHHIWYDHLNVWDAGDGMLDITNQSDYQTVSWCKFWYTNATHDHRLASLNGSGGGDHPEDEGYLRVTYHHNWWAELVDQRMPRVMYGDGHEYNNFFNSPGNGYCIGVGSYGSVLVENNYFKDVKDPHVFMYALWSHATARGNVYDNTTGARNTGYGGGSGDYQPAPFTDPPYDYALDPAANVPNLVTRCAGPR